MTTNRIDDLLSEALATGHIPADATPAEREEVAQLLAAAEAGTLLRAATEAEARASLPTARARFQRYVAANQPAPTTTARPPRSGILGRLFRLNSGFGLAFSAAAVAVVLLVATLGLQLSTGAEPASALTLQRDDFVQVTGTVTGSSGTGPSRSLTVATDLGPLRVTVGDQLLDVATPANGDLITVAGSITRTGDTATIDAISLTRTAGPTITGPLPKLTTVPATRLPLEGTITLFTVARDGKTARAVIETAEGDHFVVRIGASSLGTLLSADATPVGARVRVTHQPAQPLGEFTVEILSSEGSGTQVTATPGLLTVVGVLQSRRLNQLTLATPRGDVTVVIRPSTRIVIGPGSGLTAQNVRNGETAIGHELRIQGAVDRATGRVVAEVLWVGPKP